MHTTSPLHAVTWLLWALAAAACVQLAPSPVYVALVTAIAFLVVSVHRLDGTLAKAFPILVTLGVVFAAIRVALTALTTHTAANPSDVWFTLPQATLPRILGGFTVGGTIEATVVLQSAAQAFAVVGILAAFGAFNAVASHYELVQATPRAFHEPGLVITVALAFVPSTMAAVQAAREGDRARTGGRVVRRGRLLRLAGPILESGLERAMALAESMDARGFARLDRTSSDRAAGWLGMASMLALGGSLVALVGRSSAWALVAAVTGMVGLIGAILLASRGTRTTRYRPRKATFTDVWVAVVVLAAPVGIAVLSARGNTTLVWTATPLRFPALSLGPLLCLALLAVPAAVSPLAVSAPASAETSPSSVSSALSERAAT